MGNPNMDGSFAVSRSSIIDNFYSEKSWIEGSSVEQLKQVSALQDVLGIKAFPDIHPGKYGPVGCAILSKRIYPHLIGNDIGCGMSLFTLELPSRKLRIDKAAVKLSSLEEVYEGNAQERLWSINIDANLHDHTLGTIGGGNHFCEVQAIDELIDENVVHGLNLDKSNLLLLVHSGSRSLGASIFASVQKSIPNGFDADSVEARVYMRKHDEAVQWAKLNRQIIAERAASSLRTTCRLISDSPHNLIEHYGGGFLHRKGSAKADMAFVPLAGSRDALSYLLKPTSNLTKAYHSLAHGSGRKYDRQSMQGREGKTRSEREKLLRTSFGGQVVCGDRQLLIEEAPSAYKDSSQVMNDLDAFGLATPVLSLKPLLTFKRASKFNISERKQKRSKLSARRRAR